MGEPPANHADQEDDPESLLARYLDGDADAFTQLVARYETSLYAFLVRFLGDAHRAEDVFQQTFMKVATKGHTFTRQASFSTWLFSIARHQAMDELRKRRLRPAADLAGDQAETTPDRNAASPLDLVVRDELMEKVRRALDSLPDPQRETFLLKEEAELSFKEIGIIMNCEWETAKSRFRLAVEKLRKILGNE